MAILVLASVMPSDVDISVREMDDPIRFCETNFWKIIISEDSNAMMCVALYCTLLHGAVRKATKVASN